MTVNSTRDLSPFPVGPLIPRQDRAPWTPGPEEHIRVACVHCGAHRDRSTGQACRICHTVDYTFVRPLPSDIEHLTAQILAAVDVPSCAIAHRKLARARAGYLEY